MTTIDNFKGDHGYLSNFYPAPIWFADRLYATTEHAFQAMKTTDERWRGLIRRAESPGVAKRLGRQAPLRSDWDEIKDQMMHDIVWTKFVTHAALRERLLATGQAELVEGNTWHDEYWGVDRQTNRGQNKLGKILMQIRKGLQPPERPE